jgi:spore coat protein A
MRAVRQTGFLILAGVLLASLGCGSSNEPPKPAQPLSGNTLTKFLDPLPAPEVIDASSPGTKVTITMSEFSQQVLPSDFKKGRYGGKTLVWGYNESYPGPTISAERGVPVTVHYVNNLVNPILQQFLTVDQTLHWADPYGLMCREEHIDCSADPANPCCSPYEGAVPAVAHLHGGEVPSAYDGGPLAWFTPGLAITGPGFVTDQYVYPNTQEAATLWYHDHALGATRLNVYSGLAGFYILTDKAHQPAGLPSGPYERAMVIQDRSFDVNGQLYFPASGDNPEVHPFWLPEFFGDVIVVNGKAWPYLSVEPRKYRFRVLNGSSARFYHISVVDSSTGAEGPEMVQIGTDGGYLDSPVTNRSILLAPAERADVIIDFKSFAGKNLTVINDANAPYPDGDPADPETTGQIMQFRVSSDAVNDTSVVPANLRPNNPIVHLAVAVTPNTPVRRLTLNELIGANGPLEVLLNNSAWEATTTETPRVGSTEIWEIVNLTGDTHPIHLHLIQFQLLNRQDFDVDSYMETYEAAFPGGVFTGETGPPMPYGDCYAAPHTCGGNPDVTPYLTSAPVPATNTNEYGWKDTVRVNPGQVTRLLMRWAPQDAPISATAPGVNLFSFDPAAGPGYVWHCHILDHEDNEMMRPLVLRP